MPRDTRTLELLSGDKIDIQSSLNNYHTYLNVYDGGKTAFVALRRDEVKALISELTIRYDGMED